MPKSLNIGLVAYHVVGNLAFVKVPSERGRYLLTDLCVITVPCPYCNAIVGEPCRRNGFRNSFTVDFGEQRPVAHGCSVHTARKLAAEKKHGRHWQRRVVDHYRVHLAAGDVAAALADAPEPGPEPEPVDVTFDVTLKEKPDAAP